MTRPSISNELRALFAAEDARMAADEQADAELAARIVRSVSANHDEQEPSAEDYDEPHHGPGDGW